MISIRRVTRRFGRIPVVDDVSLEIAAGESVALWGANGAGKTTLLRCVLGLLRCRGSITVDGFDVHRRGKFARRRIGYVPQEIGFYDDLGVGEAVRFFGRLKGITRLDAAATLDPVGLAGEQRKRVRELSGGMKQRLALAIALLGDPPILLLDEVTTSLDALGRREFVVMLEQLAAAGRTLLFASHRVDEVAALAQRVARLDRGRLVATAACDEFCRQTLPAAQLHLTIAEADREPALRFLRDGGFDPRHNGRGVIVPVTHDNKPAPFRLLADAQIRIHDFEWIDSAHTAPAASHEGAPR